MTMNDVEALNLKIKQLEEKLNHQENFFKQEQDALVSALASLQTFLKDISSSLKEEKQERVSDKQTLLTQINSLNFSVNSRLKAQQIEIDALQSQVK